jgi:O-antigen/teichoic acid export membrane protein
MKGQPTENSGYKNAFKATALFGSVQVFIIIINILKSKVVAMWLGTIGFGILGIFSSATNLISATTNLGLQSSAVRDIAKAKEEKDELFVSKIAKAINRWVLGTGFLGAFLTIILSSWLSQLFFKSNNYTLSFVLLSSVIFLTGVYRWHYALLQGTRNLSLVAKANILGAVVGFLCSLPMFYFFREEGIVWALILTAISTTIVSFIYAKKLNLIPLKQSYKQSYVLGLNTVQLGIMMAISNIAVQIVQFATKTLIVRLGGISDVGLYQAGWALNATYLGLIFTAMGKDYFPRLSQSVNNLKLTNSKVNEQAEIAVLLLAPFIVVMIVFMPFLIKLLYTNDFLQIISMTKWLLIGSIIKAGSWGVSFVFLAKGDGKLFLFNELGIKLVTLPSYLLSYYWFGLTGIGYAYIMCYIVYFIWVGIISSKKYKVRYNNKFWKIFITILLLLLIYPIGEYFWDANYLTGIILIICISVFSGYELNSRLDFIVKIKSVLKKFGILKK